MMLHTPVRPEHAAAVEKRLADAWATFRKRWLGRRGLVRLNRLEQRWGLRMAWAINLAVWAGYAAIMEGWL